MIINAGRALSLLLSSARSFRCHFEAIQQIETFKNYIQFSALINSQIIQISFGVHHFRFLSN